MKQLVEFANYVEDFNWDYNLHFPVPSVKYVARRTGVDLLKFFDTSLEADGSLVAITRTAKNILFSGRRDMLAWEYDIAHNLKLIYEVLEYVLEFVNFAFISGDYQKVFEFENNSKSLPQSILNARGNLVGAKKIIPAYINYREGY